MSNSDLLEELRGRELRSGGWSFFGSRQVSLEATSLASLCLLAERPSEGLGGAASTNHAAVYAGGGQD